MKSCERRITLTPRSAEVILKNQKPNESMSQVVDRLLSLNPFLSLAPADHECFEDSANE